MRVISPKKLRRFWQHHSSAESPLRFWLRATEAALWRSFAEIRATFRSADSVQVRSGAAVVVFDIGGNKYRLIAAVHYNTQTLFVLRVFTHKEYDLSSWKDEP